MSPNQLTEPPVVVVVDDDIVMTTAWQLQMTDAHVRIFESPEALLQAFEEERWEPGQIAGVVLDYCFEDSPITGSDIAKQLRMAGIAPLVLSSNMPVDSAEEFTAVVPKKPCRWQDLLKQLTLNNGDTCD